MARGTRGLRKVDPSVHAAERRDRGDAHEQMMAGILAGRALRSAKDRKLRDIPEKAAQQSPTAVLHAGLLAAMAKRRAHLEEKHDHDEGGAAAEEEFGGAGAGYVPLAKVAEAWEAHEGPVEAFVDIIDPAESAARFALMQRIVYGRMRGELEEVAEQHFAVRMVLEAMDTRVADALVRAGIQPRAPGDA